jgi:hypothetical protein
MALELLYMFSTVATKISILLFYRRLIPETVSQKFRWAVYAAISSILIYWIIFIVLIFTRTHPLYADWMLGDPFWEAEHPGVIDYQLSEGAILTASAIISSIQDFMVCFMPMTIFWNMTIPKRQRIALGAIFAVGFLYANPSTLPK